MDEIYYIVGIDARPWKKTTAIGAIIPIVLFFASIEAFRYTLNKNVPLGNAQRYFVIILLVISGLYVSKHLKRPWREEYTKRFLLNTIYLGLIATGFSNALFYLANIQTDAQDDMPPNRQTVALSHVEDQIIELLHGPKYFYIAFVAFICGVALLYIAAQTSVHLRAEAAKLACRPSLHIFKHHRAKEIASLRLAYVIYFFGSVALVSYLVIA